LIANLDPKAPKPNFPGELKPKEKYPLFVTWKKRHNGGENDYRLRGCIGTFSPQDLIGGLQNYAITSALKDSRFSPVRSSEVNALCCDVSLLTTFEDAKDIYDWKVGQHGITIEFVCPVNRKSYSATYLPEVASEQGWSRSETIRELIAKSGYTRSITSQLHEVIRLTRYQSSKASLSYAEYKNMRSKPAPAPLPAALAASAFGFGFGFGFGSSSPAVPAPHSHLTPSPVHLHINVRKDLSDGQPHAREPRFPQPHAQIAKEPESAREPMSAMSLSSGSGAVASPSPSPDVRAMEPGTPLP